MVAQSADEAIANADSWSSCDAGMCLYTVQEWIESGHAYPDAASQWHAAQYQHTDDDPPAGAPVFWTGGSHGYGHVAISKGNGRIRSTDCTSTNDVSDCDLSWPRTHWGLTYAGWTEDLADVRLPYLGDQTPQNPNGLTIGDTALVTASLLNGRDQPSSDGDVVAQLPYGESFVVAQIVDGWATDAPSSARSSTEPAELVPVLATDYLHGWDISSNNASSWAPADDECFGWVKCSEGKSYVNPEYARQLELARDHDQVVGHYHWLNDGDVTAQVAWFIANADVRAGDMIAVDWEDSSNPTSDQKDDALAQLKQAFPSNRVGLYCNRDWWLNHDTSSNFGEYLWIAVYGEDDPGIQADWLFWQYTSEPYDKNHGRFADVDALRSWASCDEPEPPTPSDAVWFSTDYLFPKLDDPSNPNSIEPDDHVVVTANGGLKARELPGGPQTIKDGEPLVRDEGYDFDVTDVQDGWASGGTNWYSTDYLDHQAEPTEPSWSSKPHVILDDPTPDEDRDVSYLQACVRVGPVDTDEGRHYDERYVIAQDRGDKGDLRFAVCHPDGTYQDEWMQVNDAGHGQTFHAYRSAAGTFYLWCGEDPAYRYKWQNGKTVSRTSGDKMDFKGARPVGSHEPWVGFRDATDSKETFYLFDRSDFTDGTNRTTPVKSCTLTKQTKRSQQSWAVSEDRIYRLSGSTNDDPPHGSMLHVLEVFDWNGSCLLTLDVTAMSIDTTSDEPEGVTFTGTPGQLLVGKREGSTSPSKRSYPLWLMSGLP